MSRSTFLLPLILLCAAPFLSAQRVEGSFDRTVNVSGPVQLHVSTGSGAINIRRGPGGSVRVQGRIRASTNSLSSAGNPAARVKEIEQNPPIRQTGNIVTVGSEVQRWDNVSISYDVTVPEQTQVTADTGSGGIETYDVRGPADLKTGSGSVRADNIGATVQARTGSGMISVDGARGDVTATTGSGGIQISRVEGNVEAHTGSGHVTVSGASGRIRADASSGGVTIEKAQADIEARSGSGTIAIDGRPKSARWDARTSSGGIRISLPVGTAFEVDASTSSGSVSTSHSVTTTGTIRRGTLRGVAGKADNRLYLHTGSGSIRID